MRVSCNFDIRSCFTPWREHQQRTSWMAFAAAVFVFAAEMSLLHIATVRFLVSWLIFRNSVQIAFVRLSAHGMSWMSAESPSRRADYRRISHPVAQDEGDNENGIHKEMRRTLIPESNAENRNDWKVD